MKLEMEGLKSDVYKLEVSDRKNARCLAKVNMWPQITLSAMFILGYFGIIYMLFGGHIVIDDSIRDMANILIGVMTANIPSIMSFWFGSSSSSKYKTHILGNH